MSTIFKTGSITLVDISDVGTLSVTIEANQPAEVIYIEDTETWYPSWTEEKPLRLTANITYNGASVSDRLNISWSCRRVIKDGSNDEIDLSNETSTALNISDNPFIFKNEESEIIGKVLAVEYICNVTYTNIDNIQVTGNDNITFRYSEQKSTIGDCKIKGASYFTYNADGTLNGPESIILYAEYQNCTFECWERKDSDGTFTTIENASSNQLEVVAATEMGENNEITYRLVAKLTNNLPIYDYHTISKLYNGNDASPPIIFDLSNQYSGIPCTKEGYVIQDTKIVLKPTITQGNNSIQITKLDIQEENVESDKAIWEKTISDNKDTVTITVKKDQQILNNISLKFTATYQDTNGEFELIKTFVLGPEFQGEQGVVLQIVPQKAGHVINGPDDKVILKGVVYNADIQGANWTWQEYDFINSKYTNIMDDLDGYIIDEKNITLTIPANKVLSTAQYKLILTLANEEIYEAYQIVEDTTDLKAQIFSSLGDKIINSQGYGALYARAWNHSQEVDALYDTFFIGAGTALPDNNNNNLKNNDRYFLVTINNGITKADLYKYNERTWIEDSDPEWDYEYQWTFKDIAGNPTTFMDESGEELLQIEKRFLFIDGSRIKKKIQFNLHVSKEIKKDESQEES